jgi:hypothetical protein
MERPKVKTSLPPRQLVASWPLRVKFLLNFGFTPEAAILTTSGVARVDDFRTMSEALVDNPRFRAGMPILIDHTSLDASVLTATDVRAIGAFVATIGERLGPCSIAVVVPDKLTFGFVRMGEMRANQPQLNVRIFYSLPEAVQWLHQKEPPAPASTYA